MNIEEIKAKYEKYFGTDQFMDHIFELKNDLLSSDYNDWIWIRRSIRWILLPEEEHSASFNIDAIWCLVIFFIFKSSFILL